MLQFRCSECLALITIDADVSTESAVCSNCNIRQLIPDDASAVSVHHASEKIPFGSIPRTAVPLYPLANALGAILIVLGLVGAIICLFFGVAMPPLFLVAISFLTLAAIGIVMHLLRAIAIDVRRIRDA